MGTCPDTIKRLIERFNQQSDQIRSPDYNETLIRIDFINPLMTALGWDIDNSQGFAEQYREVVHEDRVKVAGQTKAPDYSFRIGGARKFFLEAKKPAVDIKNNWEPAYQLRRYAWSAKLACSLLTDFEELAIYDTRVQPKQFDKAREARREFIHYTEYPKRWDFIGTTFSKDAVLKGEFDRYCESKKGRGAQLFDDVFLGEIEEWRKSIAGSLARNNDTLDEAGLNFSVQRIIDRIIFLRIAEDRGTENVGQLQALLGGEHVFARLNEVFRRADERYNSGLFHFAREKDRDEAPDTLTPTLDIDDKTLKTIIKGLYYPQSPYEFTVVSADILGSVYERFLGKVITLTAGHNARIEEKPEVRKAGGVYYTPTYIVDYIVKNTVGKLLLSPSPLQGEGRGEGRSVKEPGARDLSRDVSPLTPALSPQGERGKKIKILDPACGSGSFLIGAYQFLLDWYLNQYLAQDPAALATGKKPVLRPGLAGGWSLTIAERKRILLDHIHGVDLDGQAVEVTKLNLLLKCLEGETSQTLGFEQRLFRERALPDLGKNILCGNSLIGTDMMLTDAWTEMTKEKQEQVKPFDYERAFPQVFKGKEGGFDAVIGNPPYIDSEWMSVHWPETRTYCVGKYEAASGNWDIFCVFLDRAELACKPGGFASMIVPNKLATAGYAAGARSAVATRARLVSLRDYSKVKVFPVAVYPIVVTAVRAKAAPNEVLVERVTVDDAGQHRIEAAMTPYSGFADVGRGWDLSLSKGDRRLVNVLRSRCVELSSVATVVGAATVSEAYKLTDLLSESVGAAEEIRVVNSGTIDRFCDHWGSKPMRYLGEKFLKPVVSKRKQSDLPPKRLQQARTKKIIIAGMTLRLECCLDFTGSVLAAKSTTLVLGDINHRQILAILNSNLMKFIYEQEFGGDKLQGGYLRVGPPQIERLPIPAVDTKSDRLATLVDTMLSLQKRLAAEQLPQRREQIQREIDATDRQIDQLVYQLYGLTDAEIAIVEQAAA